MSGVAAFAAAVCVAAVAKWRESIKNDKSGRICKLSVLPADCEWMDQASFEVLTAICDAMIPSYNADLDCSQAQLEDELHRIGSNQLPKNCALSVENLIAKRRNLLRGAVESRTHILSADALQSFAYKFDQHQLYILLRLLGTSVGCYLICGYPVPYQVRTTATIILQCFCSRCAHCFTSIFQHLPLKYREIGLSKIRDSSLADIRAAYQVSILLCVLRPAVVYVCSSCCCVFGCMTELQASDWEYLQRIF